MFKGINRFNDRRLSKSLYKIINSKCSSSPTIFLSSTKSFTSVSSPIHKPQQTTISPIHFNSKTFCLNNNNNIPPSYNIRFNTTKQPTTDIYNIKLNNTSNNNIYIRRIYSTSTSTTTTTNNNTTNNNQNENNVNKVANEVKDWISKTPLSIQPYLRLGRVDKPIGTWLLLYPCLWSIAIATPIGAFPDPLVLAVFVTGAFVMRSAGCVINDMADYKS